MKNILELSSGFSESIRQFHAKIKEITGTNHRFLGTMFSLDTEGAGALVSYIQKRASV